MDQDELKDELAQLEDEQLQERLAGAERVPMHSPVSNKIAGRNGELMSGFRVFKLIEMSPINCIEPANEEEEDEEVMLRKLQMELAA